MRPLAVASFNMGHASTTAVAADLARLAKQATIICLQEAGDRAAAIRLFLLTHPRWRVWTGDVGGGPKVPILWRSADLALTGEPRTHIAVGSRRVVPVGVKQVGAGPPVLDQKAINRLPLRHKKSGLRFEVLNTHLIASATRHDMSAAETHLRREHYADHIEAVIEVIGSMRSPVVLTADFNAEKTFDLLDPLDAVMDGWTTTGTHGQRAIDHVLHRGLRAAPTTTVETSSDHLAVVATLRGK